MYLPELEVAVVECLYPRYRLAGITIRSS